jgi:nicotinamidase-related amidase
MKKNIILIVAGVGDFFFGKNSYKNINKKEELLNSIETIVEKNNYKAVVNLTTPHDTLDNINVFKNLRQQSVVTHTLHSEKFLHKNNEIALTSVDNEEILLDGDQLDFVLRPQDYDIHICGVDVNGAFKSTIEDLLAAGYHVTVYSDAIRPFNSTAKYISGLNKTTSKFRYCSFKSV